MKKNMRKVPIIQIKSDIYHSKEDDEAENIISSIDKIPSTTTVKRQVVVENNIKDDGWFGKLINKIKEFILKIISND